MSWSNKDWLANRAQVTALDAPVSICEVHLGSWRQRPESPHWMSYQQLADELIPYVKEMGYTHIEMLPITGHPFDGSWGYQPIGMYAPTWRFGTPHDFKRFIDQCHREGISVILDWVPAHFPRDSHGLGEFDGTHLYEHADPRQGAYSDWGTLIFNYGRKEVVNYLLANALFWLKEFHIVMYGHPGKKLMFMGSEFAQRREWNFDSALDWGQLDDPQHAGVQRLVREGYRLGVPEPGNYEERLNSDSSDYAGSGVGNLGGVVAEAIGSHGRSHSLSLTLPPLAALVLQQTPTTNKVVRS